MNPRAVVFSDIDYTIVFDSELRPRTAALIQQVRQRAPFILVTARSRRECLPLPPIPSDGLVAENGAAIYLRRDGQEVLDEEWDRRMAARQEALDALREELQAEGWRIHHKLRAFSSSLTRSGKSEDDLRRLRERLPQGLQLQLSRNTAGEYIEVFPVEAGKDKAVWRLGEDLGAGAGAGSFGAGSFGLGDNTNDLDLLRVVTVPLAPGNCHPQVRELVTARGGYVSPHERHAGAQDILEEVLRRLD